MITDLFQGGHAVSHNPDMQKGPNPIITKLSDGTLPTVSLKKDYSLEGTGSVTADESVWRKAVLKPDSTVYAALEVIDQAALQVALVVDDKNKLLGVVTDGDIRRAVLKKQDLNGPVHEVMTQNPRVARVGMNRREIVSQMDYYGINQMPLLDKDDRLIGVEFLGAIDTKTAKPNVVVLMAGGKGTRLRPLTEDIPKPLLKVGDQPILETILNQFLDQGFRHFYLSVNYHADKIIDYFGDGRKWGARIEYIHETEPLGTAGALALMPRRPRNPMIVMNGDLMTKVNFSHFIDYHNDHGAQATMGVNKYEYRIPFGVPQVNDELNITEIVEKPTQNFFVNAGMYIINPEILDSVPRNTFYDMPTLLQGLIDRERAVTAFPIREYWLDVGRHDDFEKAQEEFMREFRGQ